MTPSDQPGASSPGASSPGASSPGASSPSPGQPGPGQPGASSPSPGQPGADQQGRGQSDPSEAIAVRPIGPADRGIVQTILGTSWNETQVAAHGVLYDAADLPGYVAEVGDQPAGLLTYHVTDDGWEIVTLDATVAGHGVGTLLLRAVEDAARAAGATRLWLITTNENVHALRFYQRRGFDLVTVHRNAVTAARADLKPSIPLEVDGIPLRHELELERLLR